MPDYFYQITDLNDNIKGEIRDKALTDLETAANAGKFVQISGNQTLTAADESIFIAVYGTTTASEVQAAINAGKLVMAMKSDGQSIALLCGIASTVYSFCYSAPNATANTGYPWFSMWTLNRSTNSWNTVHTTQVAKRENSDLTGTPTAPTAAVGTNTTQIATTAFVQTAIEDAFFVAEYGVTTYAEISAVLDADKPLFCYVNWNDIVCPYIGMGEGNQYVFSNIGANASTITLYVDSSNAWSYATTNLATQSAVDDKQAKITASGILKGDGSGGVSAATAGTDYVVPSGSITGTAGGLSATLGVSKGGTGKTSVTKNAILAGNASSTTGALAAIATASGALYATAANGAATFGTLPVAQGGTGATSAAGARTNLGAAAASHTHAAGDITGTLGVAHGGTGATTFTSGAALIGAGTGAVTTRSITNNTAATTAITGSTNLVTMNTLRYALNRTTGPGTADTDYTTAMMRAIKASTTDLTAGSSSLTSGTIYLVYED